MSRLLRLKLSRLFRRARHEAELDAELRFHLEQLVAENRAQGMSEREAALAARRELGEVSAYREEVRDAWRPPELADLWRTLRFACRSLLRSPGLTTIAVVTLALGIGANTVMFSAFNSIVLKPLPYPDPGQLDRIDRTTSQNREGRVSPADFLDLKKEEDGYGEIAAYALGDVSLAEPGQPTEMARGLRTTGNFFATLRVAPQLGRDFLPGEDRPGNDRVVIISRRLWQNRFGGRADIIGRAIRIDGVPHDIVGVLPASFNDWRHLGAIEVFRPLALDARQAADRQRPILRLIGRRAAEPSRAAAFIASFGARLAEAHPEGEVGATWRTVSLAETTQGENGRTIIAMLIGLSGFVLLIACSNLANLLLARTVSRGRELAVRAALGASRGQLLRPLLVESLLLALAGGACALVVVQWGSDWLAVRSTGDNGEQVALAFDWAVFCWAFGASLVTAVAFGMAPALYALRLDLAGTLKSGGRSSGAGRGHRRFRQVLIVGQFAAAMVLLAGAGLFVRGLDELNRRRAGWASERLVTGSVTLPVAAYPDAGRIAAFHRLALERIQALPGVASASASSFPPYFNWLDVRRYVALGRERPEPGHEPAATVNSVTPRYFETVGTRLVAGRAFDERDGAAAPRVFMINQTMATALYGAESPLGRRLVPAGATDAEAGEIVGVVADVRSVLPDPPPAALQLYQPLAQEPRSSAELEVRIADGVAPATAALAIRAAIAELDPDLPVRRLQAADATIDRANSELGVLRDILSAFAVIGLGLALLGVYGVIARTMAQRTSEFAIRFALGARVLDVTRLVLATGLRLALLGAAIGVLGSLGVSRILAAGFPGMRLSSPLVLGAATLLLVAVALLACWIPARRAARIQPMEALRAD